MSAHRFSLSFALVLGFALNAMSQASKSSMVLYVDHASVCAGDLAGLQEAFSSAGLATDYGGPHANGVTHMALLGFDDGSYLELIAPQKAGVTEGSNWSKLMAADAGPCAWAVSTADAKQDSETIKANGVVAGAPTPGSRKRPDGLSIEWTTVDLGSGTTGGSLPFLIEDRTPHNWRVQPSASVKESGLTGIEIVVLAVNDLNTAVALFRKAFNWAEPLIENHKDFDAKIAYFPGTPVMLAAPSDSRSWLGERLQKFGETPVAFLLATRDLPAATKKFHLAGGKSSWFGQKIAWFDAAKLKGVRLGALGQ